MEVRELKVGHTDAQNGLLVLLLNHGTPIAFAGILWYVLGGVIGSVKLTHPATRI